MIFGSDGSTMSERAMEHLRSQESLIPEATFVLDNVSNSKTWPGILDERHPMDLKTIQDMMEKATGIG